MKTQQSEAQVQASLCQWLTLRRVRFFSVPNGAILGGANRWGQVARLRQTGLTKGAPDLVIIDRAPNTGRTVAVEVKRAVGGKLSPAQQAMRDVFVGAGWSYVVAWGLESGINQMIQLGY